MATPNPGPWNLTLPIGVEGLDPTLRVRDEDGRVLCAMVLLATLYIEHGDTPEARAAIVRAHERYLREAGDVMRWFANPDTGVPEPLTDPFRTLRTWPSQLWQLFELQIMMHGGVRVDDADPHTFIAISREVEEGELSLLSVALPLTWAEAHDPAEFTALVVDLCDALKPAHGYAGLGVIPHVSGFHEQAERPLFNLARRFRGLELDVPEAHAPVLQSLECIKGVNWLTVVSDAWLLQAGGEQQVLRLAGSGVKPERFAGGVVLQAGPAPRLGDTSINEPMPFYEQVAQALAPIRCGDPMLMATHDGIGFDDAEAIRWLARFG